MTPHKIKLVFFSAVAAVAVIVIGVVLYSRVLFPQSYKMGDETSGRPRVVIVGGGLAGLAAAIEASRHGAHVTILEKEKNIGGNSAKATSGINGVGTPNQRAKGIEDSVRTFIDDTMQSSDGLSDPELVNILATNSAAAIDWLDSFGLVLSDIVQLGGHSVPRTHRFPPTAAGKPVPVGFTMISRLRKYLEADLSDTVTAITQATFTDLTIVDGRVTGVRYVNSDGVSRSLSGAVIFTTGGYANDHSNNSLLDEYVPKLASLPTTNGKWATGDVIKATRDDHLSLIHMDKVQVHPTGFIEIANPTHHTKFLAPEALRGCGAILLDSTGRRFVNELGRRDYVTATIFSKCRPFNRTSGFPISAIMLLTQAVIDRFGPSTAGFYQYKQLIVASGSLTATATMLGIDLTVLQETVSSYRTAAEAGNDSFGKTTFPVVFSESDQFFVAYVTPSLHYCMGGLRINANTQVYQDSNVSGDTPGHILSGLYAAAEVTGGVHGNNRLGGNSLLECVVFGRIAGQHAAHFPNLPI